MQQATANLSWLKEAGPLSSAVDKRLQHLLDCTCHWLIPMFASLHPVVCLKLYAGRRGSPSLFGCKRFSGGCSRNPVVLHTITRDYVRREASTYDLTQRGFCVVTGRNEDDQGSESNGAGKSALVMAPLWALTGKSDARVEASCCSRCSCLHSCHESSPLVISMTHQHESSPSVITSRKSPSVIPMSHYYEASP